MKVIQSIGGFVILFILFSCSNNAEIYKSEYPDKNVRLRLNVQERISDNLLLEITELRDFRCPVGAVCSHTGYVEVAVRVFTDEGISNADLVYNEFRRGAENIDTINGHIVELVEVTPYPFIDQPAEVPENYTVSLIVREL